jgi:hypothetical protein
MEGDHTMSRELLQQIEARFRSGNSVPVERAHITADEWAVICANLQAAKPEQAQTAVGLPEAEINTANHAGIRIIGYTADQMESYATAKTAEAVKELVEVLVDEGLRRKLTSLPLKAEFAKKRGISLDDVNDWMVDVYKRLDVLIAKYAPKKERDNG